MQIEQSHIGNLLAAHTALDAIKEDKTPRYDFTPKVDWSISKNIRVLAKENERIEELRQDLVRKHGLRKFKEPEKEAVYDVFLVEWRAAMQGELDLPLLHFIKSDFRLSNNKIPRGVLATLAPLIDDFESDE